MIEYWEIKKNLSNSENQKVINEFLLRMKNKNRSKSTINTYRKMLEFIFKKRDVHFSSFASNDIQQLLMEHQEWKEKNFQRYLSILRCFYNFCVEEGYMDKLPFQDQGKRKQSSEAYWEVKITLPNKRNQIVINDFLLRQKDRNKSKSTILNYRSGLQFFFKEREGHFSSLSSDDIQQWILEHQKEWTEKNLQHYVGILRSFYHFCVEEGYMDNPPIQNQKKRKKSLETYWEVKQPLPNKENEKVINEFLLSRKNRNMSKGTIINYRCMLRLFYKERERHFSSITSDDIQQWLLECQKKWKEKKLQNHLRVLSYFYHFCVEKGKMEKSPIPREKSSETYWKVKTPFSNEENQKVVNEFLLSLKSNNSKEIIINYRKILQSFFEEREERFSALRTNDYELWLLKYQKGRKKETITNLMGILRSFYQFCVEKGYIEKSPILEGEVKYWELKIQLPNDENQKVINEFLLSLKNANRSKKAINSFRDKLQILFKEKEDLFSSHTSDDMKHWLNENQKHLKEKTIWSYLYCLRTFYHFCVEKGYIDKNPILYLREKEKKYWEVKIPLPNKENEERINEFLLSLYVANYSRFTVKAYRDILQNFFREKKEVYSSITSSVFHQWLAELKKKCKEGTITYRLNALNSFYQFCVNEGYIDKSPMKKRWFPRLPKPVPKFLNKREIAKVRKQSEMEILRNRVLVEFLLTSGCRVGEVGSLKRSDVDLENRTAIVMGKGQKIRQIHFSVRCAILLERYLESRHDKNPALFVTNHAYPRRLSTKWMRTILTRIGKRAELSTSLHPHRLRHTFATDLLEKGAELSFIGDELGHSSLKTTQIYANLPKQKIITLYRKYFG